MTTRTLSAAAISRQLTKAGHQKSVSVGDGSGTCTHGFIVHQTSPWKAEVCVRPQSRSDLQEQTDRHTATLRSIGYTTELYRGEHTNAPLIIRVTRTTPEN